jgi:hypothetical protein
MTPNFWKVSHGVEYFHARDMIQAFHDGLVYVHKDTKPKGKSETPQGRAFVNAPTGDYFYLTNGNEGIYLLGQFTGPANVFSSRKVGWLDRPYRLIQASRSWEYYEGPQKWWTPNDRSTFTSVPKDELGLFEDLILKPYFDLNLADFRIPSNAGI